MTKDETTTDESVEDSAEDTSITDDNQDEAAESQDVDSDETTESEDASDEREELASEDEDIKAWAEKAGVPLDDPMKMAKMVRDTQSKLHEKGGEAAELKKQIGKQSSEHLPEDASQRDRETAELIDQLRVTDFFLNNPEARQYDQQMADILAEKPHLRTDLDTLYVLARSRTSHQEILEARQTGKKEALKSMAQSKKTGAPKAAATTRDSGAKKWTDEAVARLSPEEYDKHREEILRDTGQQ